MTLSMSMFVSRANYEEELCDSCGKRNQACRDCPCNQRDFYKYPKHGFPEGDPRIDQLRRELLI